MPHKPGYSAEQNDYLRAYYNTTPKAEIMAAVPNRTWGAIMQQAHKLGLNGRLGAVPADQRWVWNMERTAIMVTHYATGGYRAVLAELEKAGLTLPTMCRLQINNQAHKLGLKLLTSNKEVKAPKLVAPKRPAVKKERVEQVVSLPILAAQKAKRRLTDKQAAKAAIITADEVRKLPTDHKGRKAYTLNACAGWAAWLKEQQVSC